MTPLNLWKIMVALPTNRNNNGTLTLYQAYLYDGDITRMLSKYTCECKGKGTYNTSDPDSWYHTDGNTPTGMYEGSVDTTRSDTEKYGPYKVIALTALSGNALTAANGTYHRNGLLIHGGRSQEYLWNTQGCIRVFNNDIKNIVDIIENQCGGVTGAVEVYEI